MLPKRQAPPAANTILNRPSYAILFTPVYQIHITGLVLTNAVVEASDKEVPKAPLVEERHHQLKVELLQPSSPDTGTMVCSD